MTFPTTVVDRLSIADVLRLGGFEQPNKRGFLCCPLHSENTPSFKVVGKGRGFRCFGCGAKGGVLDLVVALGVAANRAAAARWLKESI
jgi:DNA primase